MKAEETFKLTSKTKYLKFPPKLSVRAHTAITRIVPREDAEPWLCTIHKHQLGLGAHSPQGPSVILCSTTTINSLSLYYLSIQGVGCSSCKRKLFHKHEDLFPTLSIQHLLVCLLIPESQFLKSLLVIQIFRKKQFIQQFASGLEQP